MDSITDVISTLHVADLMGLEIAAIECIGAFPIGLVVGHQDYGISWDASNAISEQNILPELP